MTTLPTNIPNLSDVTSIVVGNLSCDGIEGNVLKVIGFLTQFETLQKRLEGRAAQEFQTDVEEAWQEFVNQFTDNTKAAWNNAVNDFEKWLANAEQGNILNGVSAPFGPQAFLEPSNINDFAIFDYDSTLANELVPGGVNQDLISGTGCSTGLGFSLGQGSTTSFAARIGENLNVAGQIASFGASLVQNPEMFLDGLVVTISNLESVLSGGEQIFASMLSNADEIEAALRPLTASDYETSSDLAEFNRLLNKAIRRLKELERNFASGDTNSAEARQAVKDATAWICYSDSRDPRSSATLKSTALLTLFQAQVNLFSSSSIRYSQLSANIADYQINLTAAAKFQPTFINFFSKVRCGLEKIQAELGTISSQNSMRFQMKKMEWCATMTTYRTLLDLYHPESFSTDLNAQFETDLGVSIQNVGLSLDSSLSEVEAAAQNVLAAANAFSTAVQTKLRQFVDHTVIEAARSNLRSAIAAYNAATQEVKDDIASFLAQDDAQAAQKTAEIFFQAAQGVSALASITQAMIDGEYDTMFTLDGLNSQLSEIAAQVISKAVECCEENGAGDPRSRAGLVELNAAQQRANDDVRAASFDEHFGANVNANTSTRVLFDLRALKQQYSRFKRLMEIPCLGGLPANVPKIV